MNLNKKLKSKSKEHIKNLHKVFLKSGHTFETWEYLIGKNLIKNEKKKHKGFFRKRTYLEKSVRVQRSERNHIKNLIKLNGDNFYTYFLMNGEDKGWIDLFCLSKKYPNVFYNVEIVSSFDKEQNALEEIFSNLFYKGRFGKLTTEEKENLFNDLKIQQINTSYEVQKDYVYGVGLHIKLHNGKETFSKEEITQTIENFLNNGEKNVAPIFKQRENVKEEIEKILFNFYKMGVHWHNSLNNLLSDYFEQKLFSEKEIALKNQTVIKNMFENNAHYKMREKIYLTVFENEDYKMMSDFGEKEIKSLINQDKELFFKNLNLNLNIKMEEVDFEKLFNIVFNKSKDDVEKIHELVKEKLESISL